MIGNRIFSLLQNILKYFPFEYFTKIRACVYRVFFKKIGKNFKVYDAVTIKYPDNIEIGDSVTINNNCNIVGKGGLKIGSYVMIGAGSKICTTTHNFESIEKPMLFQGISYKPIVIESDVWLGFDCKILPGSKIGEGSVIGAGAVVSGKEIPPYSIAVGVPARIVKNRKVV